MEYILFFIRDTVIYFSSIIYSALMYWNSIITAGIHDYMVPFIIKGGNFPLLAIFGCAIALQIILLPLYLSIFQKKDLTFLGFIYILIIMTSNVYFCSILREKIKEYAINPTGINVYIGYLFFILAGAIIFFYVRPKYDPYFKDLLQKKPFHAHFQAIIGFLFCTYSFFYQMSFFVAIFIITAACTESMIRVLYNIISGKKEINVS